jgi:hypothetical protein
MASFVDFRFSVLYLVINQTVIAGQYCPLSAS